MATILCVSSFVAEGRIGLQAIVPTLQAQGHEAVALPTIVLSNHPGYPAFARHDVPPDTLTKSVEAYERLGWLPRFSALLTGYLPNAAHVEAASTILDRLKHYNPNVIFVCDPVLGDDPDGLYIPESAAEAIRDQLVPKAHMITPNRFELEWLTGGKVRTPSDAIIASRALSVSAVASTSIPTGSIRIGNVFASKTHDAIRDGPRLEGIPHGTGDYFSAMVISAFANGEPPERAFDIASHAVQRIATASQGREYLNL